MKRNRVLSRARDFLVYVVVALALVAVSIESARLGVSHEAFIKWGGLVFMTAILFGYFISNSGNFLRIQKFWILAIILMIGHLGLFALILSHVEEWRLVWFTGMALEYPVFMYLRNKLPEF